MRRVDERIRLNSRAFDFEMDGILGIWGELLCKKLSGDGDGDGMLGLEGRYGGILWW